MIRSSAISAVPLPSPTNREDNTNLPSCNGEVTPARPSARSRLFTAIQNGFVSPETAVRFPFWSHVQPVRPCEIGTCIWCWSVVVG